MRLIYCLLTSFLFFSSCSATWRQKMTMTRIDYSGTELQTAGFYYNKNFGTFILYNYGIYLGGYSAVGDVYNVQGLVNFWKNPRFLAIYDKDPTNWGVYQIANGSIVIEKWFGRNAGEALPTAIIKGKILNDTTLVMTESNFPPQHKVKSDTFHFYPLLIKPDSTNQFIK
jgi:hypothetical protein